MRFIYKDKNKIIILFIVISFLSLSVFLSNVKISLAEDGADLPWNGMDKFSDPTSVRTADQGVASGVNADTKSNLWAWMKDWTIDAKEVAQKAINAQAFKQALGAYLKRMAYEAATYIATGDKGQAPMFQTDSVGDFITNQADNVAGFYIEALGSGEYGNQYPMLKGLDLCRPDFELKGKLVYGLINDYGPKEPDCTFSEMATNWDEEVNNPNFINKFSSYYSLHGNDLTTSLAVHTEIADEADKAATDAIVELLKNQGLKDVTDPVTGKILTPGAFVKNAWYDTFSKADSAEQTYTGDPVADAIGVFTDTLIGKLMEKLLKDGLVDNPPSTEYDWKALQDKYADVNNGGIKAAEQRYSTLIEPDFLVNEPYEILSELTECPNPHNPGPTECVLWKDNGSESSFYKAIRGSGNSDGYYTVGQAMEAGLLHKDGIFGFIAKDVEPKLPDNVNSYSYRNMKILRKYRIIPVGWELAAQVINKNISEKGPKTLGDMVACFDPNDKYTGYNDGGANNWCEGLVDPNWVLRAPSNFCKRKGPGPVLDESVFNDEYSVSRDDGYCADEQACIKEGADGHCEAYGYCTEERGVWDFGNETCEPRYNTCEAYTMDGGNSTGKTAFLNNTLNNSVCTADNAGCKAYCLDYIPGTDSFDCTLDAGSKLYADSGIENMTACGEDNEGCHEFIRLDGGTGANMLYNGSLEDHSGTVDDGVPEYGATPGLAISDAFDGEVAMQMIIPFEHDLALGPNDGLYTVANENIVFSLYAKECAPGDILSIRYNSSIGWQTATTSLPTGDEWQRAVIEHVIPPNATGNTVVLGFNSNDCKIDSVKAEKNLQVSGYSPYRGDGLFYQRKAPDYLSCDGMADPPECNDFVRPCTAEELGCDMYYSVEDDFSIPAKVSTEDYCPAECLGYDEFLQMETYFDTLQLAYFIPDKGKTCSAQAAGCDEFTNLDKYGSGAEVRDYYSQLRNCRKPDASCSEFYTWEGSSDTGYQLKVHSLQEDAGDVDGDLDTNEPYVLNTAYNSECNEDIYNLPATHADYNSDCMEFYDRNGEVSYQMYSVTVSCTDNCHPYRRTERNIITQADCVAVGGSNCGGTACDDPASTGEDSCLWSAGATSYSVFCKNGGIWNQEQNSCIYNAVPDESRTCSASQAGCREFTGQSGSNVNIILNNDFESTGLDEWTGTVNISETSFKTGQHSMQAAGGGFFSSELDGSLHADKSYTLSFIAMSNGATEITDIGLGSTSVGMIDFGGLPLSIGGEWEIFEANLTQLNNLAGSFEPSAVDALWIRANGGIFIDNIRLTEISDRYYLIKDSLTVPESCDYNINGVYRGFTFNVGCEAYTDRDKITHNLHSFSEICQDSAVGCEVMVDTHNYTDWRGASWLFGDPAVKYADGDELVYMVYDFNKTCRADEKGCQLMGKPYEYSGRVSYAKTYLHNDPDQYDGYLCEDVARNCESWNGGTVFFKDPGGNTCEWRQKTEDDSFTWNWYKTYAKFCDADGNSAVDMNSDRPCLDDSYCAEGVRCIAAEQDIECPVLPDTTPPGLNTLQLTFGYNGSKPVEQPSYDEAGGENVYWTGLCPVSADSCTEYIDPLSLYSAEKLRDTTFSINLDGLNGADHWEDDQTVRLKKNTLYVLSVEGNNTLRVTSPGGAFFRELDSDNNLSNIADSVQVDGALNSFNTQRFYTANEDNIMAEVHASTNSGSVSLKEAVIAYVLADQIDSGECNGYVDYEEGCVLFNARQVDNKQGVNINYTNLGYDAEVNIEQPDNHSKANSGSGNANELLKISPSRVCSEWLACRTLVKKDGEDICLDVGSCSGLDENYNCNSWNYEEKAEQVLGNPYNSAYFQNKTGYTMAAVENAGFDTDYYPVGSMKQSGNFTEVPNGDFEFYTADGQPYGWSPVGVSWSANRYSVLANPFSAQEENIDYPINGRSFLKYSPSVGRAISEFIDVEPGISYTLSADINTLNFHPGNPDDRIKSHVGLLTYDSSGTQTKSSGYISGLDMLECDGRTGYISGCYLASDNGSGWERKSINFTVGTSTSKIRIMLWGTVYFGTSQTCDYPPLGADGNDFQIVGATWCDARGTITRSSDEHGCLNTPAFTFSKNINSSTCSGNIYVDNIELRPVLEKEDDDFQTQECRLYPESDSLSCDYYDQGSYIHYKGWQGYCLDHDRYPGNEDNCIMWYPVDRVRGDYVDEGVGYSGKYPVYYTIESERSVQKDIIKPPSEVYFPYFRDDHANNRAFLSIESLGLDKLPKYLLHRDNLHALRFDTYGIAYSGCDSAPILYQDIEGADPWIFRYEVFESNVNDICNFGSFLSNNNCEHILLPAGDSYWSMAFGDYYEGGFGANACEIVAGDLSCSCPGHDCAVRILRFDDDGYLEGVDTEAYNNSGYHPHFGIRKIEVYSYENIAKKIVQTVSPNGKNKFWSAHVYEGSDYALPCNIGISGINSFCNYNSDYLPFGAVVPPGNDTSDLFDPYVWDSDSNQVLNQPLYYGFPDEDLDPPYQPRMGQIYEKDNLKMLFAQSYGVWEWDGSNYVPVNNEDWGPPGSNNEPGNGLCTDGPGLAGSLENRDSDSGAIFNISQPARGLSVTFQEPFNDSVSAEQHYGYSGGSATNPNWPTFLEEDQSIMYIHYDDTTDEMVLGMLHDWPNDVFGISEKQDLDGGVINFTFNSITAGNTIVMGDDEYDFIGGSAVSTRIGSSLNNGEIWHWVYDACCTDGGLVEMPAGDWEVEIEPGFISGINKWIFHYYDENREIQTVNLNLNQTIRISYHDFDPTYCATIPEVREIKINDSMGMVNLSNGSAMVNLTFNSYIDAQQMPMTMYSIDWGDNEITTVNGKSIRNRPKQDDPHSAFHLYEYWDLKAKNSVDQTVNGGQNIVVCGDANGNAANYDNTITLSFVTPPSKDYCAVRPRVKIRDNWGWCTCNSATPTAACNAGGCCINNCNNSYNWENYMSWVIVEK